MTAQAAERLAARIVKGGGKGQGPAAKRFVENYFRHAPPGDLAELGAEAMAAAAETHFKQAQNRKPGKLSIRVFNPPSGRGGWGAPCTVIQIVTDDMPFLVDSAVGELAVRGLSVRHLFHPLISVKRAPSGALTDVCGGDAPGAVQESCICAVVARRAPGELDAVRKGLETALADLRLAVTDWPQMRRAALDMTEDLASGAPGFRNDETKEARDFLRWLHDDNFTFLGYREYTFTGRGDNVRAAADHKTGLGILSNPKTAVFEIRGEKGAASNVKSFLGRRDLVMVAKANRRSRVHRNTHMDCVRVKKLNAKGEVTGERILVGLFTSAAYNRQPDEIPLLRRKCGNVMRRSGLPPESHAGKRLNNILETFPRDELFQADDDYVLKTALGVLHLQERARTALFVRRDDFGRFLSFLVYVPRDRFNSDLRIRIQDVLLRHYGGRVSAYYSHFGDSALARIHIIVGRTGAKPFAKIDAAQAAGAERDVQAVARSWNDALRETLTAALGDDAAPALLSRYARAFPAGYRDDYGPKAALDDIQVMEQVRADGAGANVGMNLYQPPGGGQRVMFKLHRRETAVPLSDVVPIFEHMGFRVLDERPHRIRPADGPEFMIHDFGLTARDGSAVNADAVRENFHDAFRRVWTGEMESDGFNALVAGAGLGARQVIVLRAYAKFLRQTGIPFSQTYVEQTLANHPGVTRAVMDLFMARFDPKGGAGAQKREAKIKADIQAALEKVVSADEDRILRRMINAVTSTLRTNFFQTAPGGGPKPYLSFKFDSRALDDMPLPVPHREIFVYSPRVEGVHLRFGPVARGGLRWSDRREDFRTEVLGLVKAQQVKNAVIVPVGSKGGFVVKRPPSEGGRQAFMDEGVACYKTFISGLLDITDNLAGAKVKPPKDVVRHDGDDPYLVVAADKGTATFSDYANEVSLEYGHWLGDAFASGGSQGYDHKAMGITARGAWESVKRHFREIGKDIQKEDFTAAGVGDMAGDVFGNGMLLSPHIRLQAAFNHMHIFIDPDPDAKTSFKERERLFNAPGTTWADYNAKLLSKGGRVFERAAKSVPLTPEIKKLLGLTKDTAAPNEVITAVLKMKVELMWFGGIGTYMKASGESHAEVGDRANDGLRINGRDLNCQVIGEGANLGVTQRGRIEYALAGGRLNTDSIDNSAGVDCSDHEVNIKILLGGVMRDGGLSESRRNALLARMTDEVADLVLRHNYAQTQAISQISAYGVQALGHQRRLMRELERMGRLNRAVEFLPDEEALAEREKSGLGLCRPEIAVLMSYAKIWLFDEILDSDLPDDPYLNDDLLAYFPAPLSKNYADGAAKHRLRREIIATRAANAIVNRAGGTFVTELMEKTGKSAADVTRAFIIARDVFGMREIWRGIEALDNKIPSARQTEMLMDVRHFLEWVTLWFLRSGGRGLDLGRHVKEYAPGAAELAKNINAVLPKHYLADARARAKPYTDAGAPEALALRTANLVNLYTGCDIVSLAKRKNTPAARAAQVYFAVGTRFRLGRLRAAAAAMAGESHWQQLAVAALIEETYGCQLRLAEQALDAAKRGGKTDAAAVVAAWAAANEEAVKATDSLLNEIWAGQVDDLAQIAVAARQLGAMTAAGSKN
ncbi:MAG: NAD-glutamate dehydrogenase [Rhodospirillales bacterium]